ncbi:UNVERIFIED_ORG: hypothetical protein GGI63_004635 [Rhizobium esperanzae]
MLALRVLTLPIALAAFAALYVAATKAPHFVESANVLIWLALLPAAIVYRLLSSNRTRPRKLKN